MERVPFLAAEADIELTEDLIPSKSNGKRNDRSSRRRRLVRTCFTVVEVCVTLALLFSWTRSYYFAGSNENDTLKLDDSVKYTKNSSAAVESCAPTNAYTVSAPKVNVWQNLPVDEVVQIRNWLFNDVHGLNLTRADRATLSDNSINLIETYHASKESVLNYFNGTAPRPVRAARVVIQHGGHTEPDVRSYVVSPLPISDASTLKPLTAIYHRPIVPINARSISIWEELHTILKHVLPDLSPIMLDLFGGSARGLPNDTMTIGPSGPFSFDGSFRRMWIQWKHNIAGDFLNPVPFYQYIDLSGTDKGQWKILKFVYDHQVFDTKEEFVEAYHNGTLVRTKPDSKIDPKWASRQRKGETRDLGNLAGPRSVSFNGLRFRVDKKEKYVTWMGWSFYLGFDRDMGMSLWNIDFLGDRIIYELAPQEAIAQYSGSDPHQASTAWLDRYFGMGALVREMIPGYDCPHESVYLPTTVHESWGSTTVQRSICIFEKDTGRPINRHRGGVDGETGAVKGYELVVRSISTVGNYDYIFDYTFMLDGSLEVRVSASGYLQGAYWAPSEEDFGARISPNSMGTLHDHVINFKVDFDIINANNSLLETKTVVQDVEHSWLGDDWGPTTRQQKLSRQYIETEDDSRLSYHKNFEGTYIVVNKDEENTWGVPRGYGIHPGNSPIFGTVVGSKRMLNNANFAKYNLAVSQRKDTEPSSSSMWNMNLPGAPPVDFDKFFDGESLLQEDIVAWVNLGMHHIPQSEDAPNTRTNIATSSFLLAPVNFHDWDISMDSSNAILLTETVSHDGTWGWSYDTYGVEPAYCIPPKIDTLHYANEVEHNLDGEQMGGAIKSPRSDSFLDIHL